jgi:hypothetical protein
MNMETSKEVSMIDPAAVLVPEAHCDVVILTPEGPRELNLTDLPREVGAMLVSVGVLGVILPGIAGMPALLAGGLVLWPRSFQGVESWFRGRYPKLHQSSMKQIGRYLEDLERRFPNTTTNG